MSKLRTARRTAARHPRRALLLVVSLAASVTVALLLGGSAVALVSRTVPSLGQRHASKPATRSGRRIVQRTLRSAALHHRLRTAVPKPTLLTTDHPGSVNPVTSMRPEGTWIVTLQVGVPKVTRPPGHSSTGMKSLFVKLVIVVVSVVAEHVGGGVTLLHTMCPAASKPFHSRPTATICFI